MKCESTWCFVFLIFKRIEWGWSFSVTKKRGSDHVALLSGFGLVMCPLTEGNAKGQPAERT